ncbi:hypothetical protein [Aquitalea aquatica]|uniref:Uncharacterized protein n=1 Tax=Aquitalea aquatica TaxID=3044273 RepID=A0A838YAH0_9NEIS|nr:hypothetical protein [Aquitalea magnusonii]MBA4707774.1 hypothetical protein [Aquitalea magnusonii]
MRIEKTIPIGDHTITIRELTVADIRALLVESMQQHGDVGLIPDQADLVLNAMLLPDVRLEELRAMAPMEPDVLDSLADSDLQTLRDKCRELNPLFFGMKARLEQAKAQAEMIALAQLNS